MKDVKKHICPTCGGNLFVDIERQMYECPFCGGTFDYDYFREESVLGIAAQALMNNEFTSAGRAYDFMLEKEPDNFEALRGKALIAMNVPKIDDISRLDLFSKIDYKEACKEIDRAVGSSKPQDREYFTVMKDIVDEGHEYVGEKAQLAAQKTERSKSINYLSELVHERDTIFIYSSSRISTKKAVILTVLCYMICCLLIFLGYKYINRNPYSKAEDLSRYETTQTTVPDVWSDYLKSNYDYTDFNDGFVAYHEYIEHSEALEREEQRKINYETWEENHKAYGYNDLIWILIIATVFFALIVFLLFMGGRDINRRISMLKVKTDEQTDKIRSHEKRMAEIEESIGKGYNRLCELHPVNE